MRHAKRVKKLKRTASHRKAMLKNLATSLFEHKKLTTTVAKAKALRPYAEHLITKAKHALQNEQAGKLPEGQSVDIHNRRIVGRHIRNKAVLQELFDTIAPMVEDRPGGYTRIIKTGFRRGDAAQTAVIELVDWAAPQDGAVGKKSKKKSTKKSKKAKNIIQKAGNKIEEKVEEAKEKVEDVKDAVEEKAEQVKEKAEDIKETAKEKAEDVKEAVEEKAEEVKEAANEKVEQAKEKAEEVKDAIKEKVKDKVEKKD